MLSGDTEVISINEPIAGRRQRLRLPMSLESPGIDLCRQLCPSAFLSLVGVELCRMQLTGLQMLHLSTYFFS